MYPVYDDWLERLIEPLSNPRVALTYGRQRGTDLTKFSEHRVFAQWFPESADPDQAHTFCNNANAAIRKSLWEFVPYDETLTGLEDVDWARRVKTLRYSIAYVPAAEIVHVHDETFDQIRRRYYREAKALAQIDPSASLAFDDFLRIFLANVVSDAKSARVRGEFGQHWDEILRFRFMQFWGAYNASETTRTSALRRRFYEPPTEYGSGGHKRLEE